MKKLLLMFMILALTVTIGVEAKDKAEQEAIKQAKIEAKQAKAEAKQAKAEAKAQKRALKQAKIDQRNAAISQRDLLKKQAKDEKEYQKALKHPKDRLRDGEYRHYKHEYFNAEGYGSTYNCKVEQQRFCRVKDFDTGVYVLCDRDVSRTQWESSKVYFKYGRCVKLN